MALPNKPTGELLAVRDPEVEEREVDILIVGGGMAACGSAFEVKKWSGDMSVLLCDKAAMERSGAVAQGLSAAGFVARAIRLVGELVLHLDNGLRLVCQQAGPVARAHRDRGQYSQPQRVVCAVYPRLHASDRPAIAVSAFADTPGAVSWDLFPTTSA